MKQRDWESYLSTIDRRESFLLNSNKLAEIWRGPKETRKRNYCAQIDDKYFELLNIIKEKNKTKRKEYIHKKDDYTKPQLTNEKRTWKEIDDAELRVDDQSMLDPPLPTSDIRYFFFKIKLIF